MRLSHIVPSLETRHGGPSKSVRALANAQASAAQVDLLYTHPANEPAAAAASGDAATLLGFARHAPVRIYRAPDLRRHLQTARYAFVHSHALWVRPLHYAAEAARRHGVPLVISPRGMMSPWAWQHHRWRKQVAAALVHPGALRIARGWHATSPEEADDIRRLGFRQPICVAPNGVILPDSAELADARTTWLDLVPAARGRRVALFYSRFHRKKRLRELLDLWLAAPRGDWLLLLVGLAEEYTVAEIQQWITQAGGNDRVAVVGGDGLPAPYAIASLFLLPSHSENFGLVIAEAFAAGLPALVTDGTPWRAASTHQAGWCVPWADYAPALATALSRPAAELTAMGAAGRTWMATDYSWTGAGRRLLDFYQQLPHA